jgi:surface protein
MPVAGVSAATLGIVAAGVTYTLSLDLASLTLGANSVKITNQPVITALNNASVGAEFICSMETSYENDITITTNAASAFIPKVISLADIPSKNTADAPFSIMDFLTTISTGTLTFSSSSPYVATINSSTGVITPMGAGTTTITANVAATATHIAGSASTTLTIVPLRIASNGVTIQYTGTASDFDANPSQPIFIQADPRNTGSNELFAVVTDSSKTQITSYAKNEQNGINYFTTSGQLVPFNNIVTTHMTDMNDMFHLVATFNYDISEWDTSNVTNMDFMFRFCTAFNQPLNSWDTSAVTTMVFMFDNATAFNQPLNLWDVSAVTNMNVMFRDCRAFDQPLNSWNTSAVTNMGAMFGGATAFNQPLNSWNTSAVRDMAYMFGGATAFNQPLNSWNTSAVTDMAYMFEGATAFNQNIGLWDTSEVRNMSKMFAGAILFNNGGNSSIGLWDTSLVTNMSFMFNGSAAFNQDLSGWDVAISDARPSLLRNNFADNSPLALSENSNKLPPFA